VLLALVTGMLEGCSQWSVLCAQVGVRTFAVTVLGPNQIYICDAVVTATSGGSSAMVNPPVEAGRGCVYAVFDGSAGQVEVTASKPGYLDAHATVQVRSTGGSCPQYRGNDVTLHLIRAADAGVSDGGE
jgi:hypothetical protein